MTPSDDNLRRDLNIALVASNYPTVQRPNVGTFIAALAEAWARDGESIDVIAPLAWLGGRRINPRQPDLSGEGRPTVRRPTYLSFSSLKLGNLSTHRLTTWRFSAAVQRCARQHRVRPDVVYSHFLYPAGYAGLRLARTAGCPAVVALGESSFEYVEQMQGRQRVAETLRQFDGILSVSKENAEIVIERYGVDPGRIEIIPNAVDTDLFHPRDRVAMREKFGLPLDATILSFAGHFIDRKGPLRVLEAMNRVDGLYGLFLGEGAQKPEGERVLHAGRVPHDEVPEWLAASDMFVLPTLAEGSPNAIIEAMACGLPVVSSEIASLRETVDDSSAILVDPLDIEALADALRRLKNDDALRTRLARGALARGSGTELNARARRIGDWLGMIVGNR